MLTNIHLDHIDISCISLGAVLTKVGKGEMDHPIAFVNRKLLKAEKNYSTMEHEGFTMVYVLQKFMSYLLGGYFKMYIDPSSLKYMVNKPVLWGKMYRWLLLFQEYDFEVIVKLGRLNVGPNHLSWTETKEEPNKFEEGFLDAHLFAVHITDNHFVDIIHFLTTRMASEGYKSQQNKVLIVYMIDFSVTAGHL